MKTFRPGQKVAINPSVPLPKCPHCGHDRGHTPRQVNAEVLRPSADRDHQVCENCFKSSLVAVGSYFVRAGSVYTHLPAEALEAAR